MPMSAKEIEDLILKSFPDAIIKIDDLRGDGDHYAAYVESKEFGALFETDNFKEGVNAFLQKRKPNFN